MIIPHLAVRNILGAGLRTWLNVIVLSFAFVTIIWTQGFNEGLNAQASKAMIDAELGGGQYWHHNYDPYDQISLPDAHGPIPTLLQDYINNSKATAILITQATIYPNGRVYPIILKGIDPGQKVLQLPTRVLTGTETMLPVLIGERMAENAGLRMGDYVTIRWRDAHGTFDALDAQIVHVMKTTVQSIDNGQLWIPLDKMQNMTELRNEATLIVLGKETQPMAEIEDWVFKDLNYLLKDIRDLARTKTVGSSILYLILLFLAMLAIFDTQIFSIFRRRKEMGTLMALGMTRLKVIQLFTLEGTMHGILAALLATVYGFPLLAYFANNGMDLPQSMDSYGVALGEKLFPIYSAGLVSGTALLVLIVVTIVSFIPTRKIVKLNPTDALRGKMK